MIVQHLSASRIKTYEQCQLKYHAVYDLKKKEGAPHPLTIMGLSVHKAMEISTKARVLALRDGGKLRDHLVDPLVILPSVLEKYKVQADLRPLAAELVQNAIDWGYFRRVDRTEWCEVPFYEEVGEGVRIKGFIDRLDFFERDADVIDLKTQKREFAENELDDNWQARIYNVAVRMLYPQVTGTVTVSFWVLRHFVQRVRLTAEDAARDTLVLVDKAREILEVSEPTATPSGLCPWCPHYVDCTAAKQGVKTRFRKKRSAA
jgi:RecB family exonuclease